MNIIPFHIKSRFVKDFLSTFSSNTILLILGAAGSMVTYRVLGPTGMGTYTVLTNFSLFFVSLVELGTRQSTMFHLGKNVFSLNDVVAANFWIWLFSSLIGVIIFYFILDIKSFSAEDILVFFSAMVIPASISNTFINGLMLGVGRFTKTAAFNVFNAIFSFLLIILLVYFFEFGVLGAILGLLIPILTLTTRKFLFLSKQFSMRLRIVFKFSIIRRILAHGVLYGVALFLMTNQKNIPVFVMTGTVSQHDIGIYSAGLSFSGLLYRVFNALSPIIFVKSAKASDPDENSLKVQKLMRVMFVIILTSIVLLFFLIDIVLPLFYGKEFVDSSNITRILLIGVLFYNVFLVLNMDMAGRGKPWLAIYTLLPVSGINYFLNFYCIKDWGITGAAFSTSFSMLIAALIFIYFYSNEIKMSISEIITPRKTDWDFVRSIFSKRKLA